MYNKSTEEFIEYISNNENIKQVDYSFKSIQIIPESIGQLQQLQILVYWLGGIVYI